MNTLSLAGSRPSTRPLVLAVSAALALLAALGVYRLVDHSGTTQTASPAATTAFVSDGRGLAAQRYVDMLITMHQHPETTPSR